MEEGKIKIYCPDSLDAWSWYNKSIAPGQRAWHHTLYDRLLLEEVLPRVRHETGHSRVATAGCSSKAAARAHPRRRAKRGAHWVAAKRTGPSKEEMGLPVNRLGVTRKARDARKR